MENQQATIKTLSGEQLALALQERYQDIQRIQNEIQLINAEINRRIAEQSNLDQPELPVEE